MARELISVHHYKVGYEIRTECVSGEDAHGGPSFTMKTAYTPDGHYIGSSKWAHRLIVKRGIKPELLPGHRVCCTGFSEKSQKWYGWSHRAICGFGIGDEVTSEEHLCACSGWTDEYLREHPEDDISLPVGFVAKNLDDAHRMAIVYAGAVG